MIYNQIIQVFDVAEAIKENGVRYYVHRLVQDRFGDYFYVDYTQHEKKPDEKPGMLIQRYEDEDEGDVSWLQVEIAKLPRAVAFFIIEALRLRSQVMALGQGDGDHGGRNRYFIWDGQKARQVSADEVKVVVVKEV